MCKQGTIGEDENRYYCYLCRRSVWTDALTSRGIPAIHQRHALQLLTGGKQEFNCVSRTTGRPYTIEVVIGADNKLQIEFAKRKRAGKAKEVKSS